jgi:hypothetical protein
LVKSPKPIDFSSSKRAQHHRARIQSRTRIRQNSDHRQGREEREGRARLRTTRFSEENTGYFATFAAFVVNSRLIPDSPFRPRLALRLVQFQTFIGIGLAQPRQVDHRLRQVFVERDVPPRRGTSRRPSVRRRARPHRCSAGETRRSKCNHRWVSPTLHCCPRVPTRAFTHHLVVCHDTRHQGLDTGSLHLREYWRDV